MSFYNSYLSEIYVESLFKENFFLWVKAVFMKLEAFQQT